MSNANLPHDPEEYFELVKQGTMDNQVLIAEIQKHGTHESCDICDAFDDEGFGSSFTAFLVESHAGSVGANVIELALSQIHQWAYESFGYRAYLAIALNSNSSRGTLDQAFEFMEEYATYREFMGEGDDYFAEILGRIAAHPLASDDDLQTWIAHNHYMFGEFSQEGHDEVEEDDFDSCEKCKSLFQAAKVVPQREV